MNNIPKLIQGALLFLLGQTLVWYQINGQFISTWMKNHPVVVSFLGVPISYVYIYATQHLVEAFNGELWPQRLIGFAMGMIAFAVLTFIHLNQAITLKTAVTLAPLPRGPKFFTSKGYIFFEPQFFMTFLREGLGSRGGVRIFMGSG